MLAILMLFIAGADAGACEVRFPERERHPQAVCADAGAQAALASRLAEIRLPRDLQGSPPVDAALIQAEEDGGWRIPTQRLAGPDLMLPPDAVARGWHPGACAVAADVGPDGRTSDLRIECAFGRPPGEMEDRHVNRATTDYRRSITRWIRAQRFLPGDDGACFSTLVVVEINRRTWDEALENGWAQEPDPAALCAR